MSQMDLNENLCMKPPNGLCNVGGLRNIHHHVYKYSTPWTTNQLIQLLVN